MRRLEDLDLVERGNQGSKMTNEGDKLEKKCEETQ